MEIGIDRFVFAPSARSDNHVAVEEVLEEIVLADRLGIHIFGIGEHHSDEFLDSAPAVLLAAAAGRTKNIRLTSAISVLSAVDPVRLYEDFATLDLVSKGRAELIIGRGAYAEAFSLFGLDLNDYGSLFAEKAELLLKLADGGPIRWSGRHRPALNGQRVTPAPMQARLPIWMGATGSPETFARAGALGLPLAVGIIGGQFGNLRPLVDLYRQTAQRNGHRQEDLFVGVHAIGFVAEDRKMAQEQFYPGYLEIFGEIRRKMGRPPISFEAFRHSCDGSSALVVGSPADVAEKIENIDHILGGVSRISLQMSVGSLPASHRLKSIELLAEAVTPHVKDIFRRAI